MKNFEEIIRAEFRKYLKRGIITESMLLSALVSAKKKADTEKDEDRKENLSTAYSIMLDVVFPACVTVTDAGNYYLLYSVAGTKIYDKVTSQAAESYEKKGILKTSRITQIKVNTSADLISSAPDIMSYEMIDELTTLIDSGQYTYMCRYYVEEDGEERSHPNE